VPEEYGPLLTLSQNLLSLRPPSLAILLARFANADDYRDFVALVREFLPERENDILGEPRPAEQMARFVSYFQDRYFPLEEAIFDLLEDSEAYEVFLHHIPLRVMGTGFEEYHEISSEYRPGLQLLTYLMEDPYEGEEGARAALAEACRQRVPAELLARVPRGGLKFDAVHELLDGTPYEALARWGDILTANTSTCFLDMDYEYLCQCGDLPEWTREWVDDLTQEWQRAEVIWNSTVRLAEWLEEDPPAHFQELLDFIERKNRHEPDPRQGVLALVFADEP